MVGGAPPVSVIQELFIDGLQGKGNVCEVAPVGVAHGRKVIHVGYKVKLGASGPTDNKGHPSCYFAGSDYVRLPLSEYNSGLVSLSSPPASAPSASAPEFAAAPPPTHISSSAAAAKRSSRSPSS